MDELYQGPNTDSLDPFEQEFNEAVEQLEAEKRGTSLSSEKAPKETPIHLGETDDSQNDIEEPSTTPSEQETNAPDQKKEETFSDGNVTVNIPENDEVAKLKSYYEQQLSLANGRLRDVASQYQKLKTNVAKPKAKEEPAPQDVGELLGRPLPSLDDAKKIIANDPEYAGALMRIFNNQLESVKNNVNTTVRNQVTPIYQQMRINDQQSHRASLLAAHPDMDDILKTGEVNDWIQQLSPIYKSTAERIFKNGTTKESIDLLTEYKNYKGQKNGNSKPEQQQTNNNGNSSKKQAAAVRKESEDLINRIKGGLAVPSGKSETPNASPQKAVSEEDEFNKVANQLYNDRVQIYRNKYSGF